MTWLTNETGSESWWRTLQQQGLPLIEPAGRGECAVTFFWRDPQGSEATSSTRRVWINITGVTDHHQRAAPRSLSRIPGTDVWFWRTQLPASWRGSYCLMPDSDPADFEGEPDMTTLRAWWREKFPTAQADALNPQRGWAGGRGMHVSPLHLPDAPDQRVWQAVDSGRAPALPLQHHIWHSARLGNRRSVWIYATGDAQPTARPLALLLDGQFWANSMPIAWPLQQLTDAGELPPAVYVMIDIIDREHRSRELPCNPDFWLALQEELLPQLQGWAPHRVSAAETLVSGQSFGGLSSVYAALNWPHHFGGAISLSGSFWWPERGQPNGRLIQQLQQGEYRLAPSRIYLEAGRREQLIFKANQQLQQDLSAAGHQVVFHPVDGGHDALCWRGGLTAGLMRLWQPLLQAAP
ncbi:MAG TPA: enterochelin esterase [Pantoea sp.]|nr:enterochelin esterase [Pantoea sp.]